MPLIRDCFRDARFPRELIPEMGRLGFFGANLEGYGCAGMNNVEYGLIMQETRARRFRPAQFRQRAGRAGDVSDPDLRKRGTETAVAAEAADRRSHRVLRADRAGIRIESGGHADTCAARMASDWILDGEKTWITNGSIADVAVVWARTEDGIRGFLVGTGHARIHARRRFTANCRCARR